MAQNLAATPGLFPHNRRITFLLSQRDDLQTWAGIPLYFGLILAPFFDHLEASLQVAIFLGLLSASFLWGRFFKRWMDLRIGICEIRPQVLGSRAPARNRRLELLALLALIPVVAMIIFLNPKTVYMPHGFMERAVGVWLVTAFSICVRRVLDSANLFQRRLWNGVAAAILLAGFSSLGLWPKSYAQLLVLLGVTYLALAVFDVALLLRLAATPIYDGNHVEA